MGGVTTQLCPFFLHIVPNEPLEEFIGFLFVLAVFDDRDALAAKRRMVVAIRAWRVGEIASRISVRVGRWVGSARDERGAWLLDHEVIWIFALHPTQRK